MASRFESELRIQERARLKELTDELAALRAENAELHSTIERTPSPARVSPGWQAELDAYVPGSFAERSPVDRLMEEVVKKSQLAAQVELARSQKHDDTGMAEKVTGLLKRLDVLHKGLATRVDGRQVAYIRSNSPSHSRSSSLRGSPREAASPLETAQQMREALQRRQAKLNNDISSEADAFHAEMNDFISGNPTSSAPEPTKEEREDSQGSQLQQLKHERATRKIQEDMSRDGAQVVSSGLSSARWKKSPAQATAPTRGVSPSRATHSALDALEARLAAQRVQQQREEQEILARARGF